ncbi:hypothetical protein KAI46_15140 [bacterium]|nr:hypothetical protein [bacterium]
MTENRIYDNWQRSNRNNSIQSIKYLEKIVDYEALYAAAEKIQEQSEDIGNNLAEKFDERQRKYEVEIENLKFSGDEMKQAFSL